ncbi:MAG: F0F1 ATP synthase subunit A [Bacillota bacterium]
MEQILRAPEVYFTIGPIEINETIVSLWVVMAILILFAIISTRKFSWLPKGRQNLLELIVEGLTGLVTFIMGERGIPFVPYIGTLAGLLILSNTAGVWSFDLLRPPTADVNTTLGLGIMTAVLIQATSIRSKGLLNYLKGFLSPFALFLPMNIISELATPVSLGFRLFGNIFGGLVIMGLIYQAVPILVPVPMHVYFDLFSGLLQTLVFILLTMVFVSMAMD